MNSDITYKLDNQYFVYSKDNLNYLYFGGETTGFKTYLQT